MSDAKRRIEEELAKQEKITLWVWSDGDDENGDGSQSNPFRTVEAALAFAGRMGYDDCAICTDSDQDHETVDTTGH